MDDGEPVLRHGDDWRPIEMDRLDASRVFDFDLLDSRLKSDPLPIFAEWLRRGRFYAIVDGVPSAVVARYEDVATVFSDTSLFSNVKPKVPGWERIDYFNGQLNIAFSDPPAHTRLRESLAPLLTPAAVRKLEGTIVAVAERLLAKTASGDGAFEAMADLAHPAATEVMLGAVVGLPAEDFHIFLTMTKEMFSLGELPPGGRHPESYLEAWASAMDYIDRVIDGKQAAASDGAVGELVRAHLAGVLSREEVVAQILTLYAGGTSPVATLIGSCLLMLARHPDQLAALRNSPELLDGAIDEVLRYHSPGIFNFRFARDDLMLGDLPVFRGMPVYIALHAANFDPAVYDDPFRFDITRPRKPPVTFGRGIHFCIGVHVARLITRIVLGAAVERFPRLRLADPNEDVAYTGGPQERAPIAVNLRID